MFIELLKANSLQILTNDGATLSPNHVFKVRISYLYNVLRMYIIYCIAYCLLPQYCCTQFTALPPPPHILPQASLPISFDCGLIDTPRSLYVCYPLFADYVFIIVGC